MQERRRANMSIQFNTEKYNITIKKIIKLLCIQVLKFKLMCLKSLIFNYRLILLKRTSK